MNPDICIAVARYGHRIALELQKRDFPASNTYSDGNWITARFVVALPGAKISFIESLHLSDLEQFRLELKQLVQEGAGKATLAMMERYFLLSATLGPDAVQWTGRIHIDRRRIESPEGSSSGVLRHFNFETDVLALPILLEQVEAALIAFPLKSPRSLRERIDNSVRLVNAFLKGKGDPNHLLDGTPLLSSIAQTGHVDAVRLLLDAGANLHSRGPRGSTALWSAVANGRTETVQLLLERGATCDDSDEEGGTILMLAARNGEGDGFPTVVQLLLEAGMDVRARDHSGWTALTCAVESGHEEIARLLIAHGADLTTVREDGRTLLMSAAEGGNMGMVRLLRAHNADISARDNEGCTALDWAAKVGWTDADVEEALR